jgi:hypothetical protein
MIKTDRRPLGCVVTVATSFAIQAFMLIILTVASDACRFVFCFELVADVTVNTSNLVVAAKQRKIGLCSMVKQ